MEDEPSTIQNLSFNWIEIMEWKKSNTWCQSKPPPAQIFWSCNVYNIMLLTKVNNMFCFPVISLCKVVNYERQIKYMSVLFMAEKENLLHM